MCKAMVCALATMAGVLVSSVGLRADEAAAVAWVKMRGGRITRDDDQTGRPVVKVELYRYISDFQAAGSRGVTDAELKKLSPLRSLRSLTLTFARVTDSGLKDLASFRNLEELRLRFTHVTDAGIKELAPLKSLRTLHLPASVTDVGLEQLASQKNLRDSVRDLNLSGADEVTDAGLKHLASIEALEDLMLQGTDVTDAGLKELASHKSLRWLYLYRTRVTAKGISELQKALPECKISQIQVE